MDEHLKETVLLMFEETLKKKLDDGQYERSDTRSLKFEEAMGNAVNWFILALKISEESY